MEIFIIGVLCGAIIWIPVGGLLGYWFAACVIAGKALAGE